MTPPMAELFRKPQEYIEEMERRDPKELHPMLPEGMRSAYRELAEKHLLLEQRLDGHEKRYHELAKTYAQLGEALDIPEGPGREALLQKLESLQGAADDARADYEEAMSELDVVGEALNKLIREGRETLRSITSRGGQA